MFTAALLVERNNRMIFLWEINFTFMQISVIVGLLQHGRHEHTVLGPTIFIWMFSSSIVKRSFWLGFFMCLYWEETVFGWFA